MSSLLTPVPAVDFSFELEDSIEGMKQMIIDEVSSFRNLVRQPPSRQSSGGARRQERFVAHGIAQGIY